MPYSGPGGFVDGRAILGRTWGVQLAVKTVSEEGSKRLNPTFMPVFV